MFALSHGLLQRGYHIEIFELEGVVAGQSSFEREFASLGVRSTRACEIPLASDDRLDGVGRSSLEPFAPVLPRSFSTICSALARKIETYCPDVVHCWSDVANLIGGAVSTSMGVPRIVLGQRTMPPPYWVDGRSSDLLRDAYLSLADHPDVVFVSNSAASIKEYETWLSLPRGRSQLVYNGYLSESINVPGRDQMADCRARLGLPLHAPAVGGVMRFDAVKDPDLWLETAAAIAAARSDVHFVLAGYGHGDFADRLFQKGEQLGLSDRLIMPGVAIDVGKIYGALDILLLTSKHENVPNVMIEAQAAGVPVVGPAVGGIGEVMLDGVTGLLVPRRSARELADAVLRGLSDPNWRDNAAVEAPAFVARKFGNERMVDETIATYGHADRRADFLRSTLFPAVHSV
jgi:glycosyltransferase involved in cell wall biosynthesis